MESKKNPEADLNKKSGLFLNIGLFITMIVMITAFEWKTYDRSDLNLFGPMEQTLEEIIEIPPTEQPPPPPPVLQQPEIIEIPDDVEIEKEVDVNLDTEVDQQTVVEYVAPVTDVVEEEIEEVFQVAETQPAPVGGMDAFYNHIRKNLAYPEQARRMGIEGRVYVEFVVDKNGNLTDVKAVKGIGGGCDEEAVRAVKTHPAWSPGKQRGRAVKVRMTVPILFKMS